MKKLHILSLASALAIATATAGFAATNSDATGGPNASTTSPSTTTVVPGTSSSAMTGQSGPYASPGRAPQSATVGPTGSLSRDATNPNGAQRPGGGDNDGSDKQ
jgi:hypothetical protein